MKTYYKTDTWSFNITPVNVIKETDKFIQLEGRTSMDGKITSGSCYYETAELAYEAIEKRIQEKIDRAGKLMTEARNELHQLKGKYNKY